MSSGCIPKKEDRTKAFKYVVDKTREALKILESIKHPDDDPRKFEEAAGLLLDASGEYGDTDYPLAADDLLEHYFS